MKSAMGSAGVMPYERSALEYIYMKPWRKSFVTREFLTNPTFDVETEQDDVAQFSAGHSIFSASTSGSRYSFGEGTSQAGYNFPVHCPNGGATNYNEAEDDDDDDKSIFRLQEPGFWVTDEILEGETPDESSSESAASISSEEDEEKSLDEFVNEYATELQLPVDVKPNTIRDSTNTQKVTRSPSSTESSNTSTVRNSVSTEKVTSTSSSSSSVESNNTPSTSKGIRTRKGRPVAKKFLNEELLRIVFETEEHMCPQCLKVFPRETTLEKHKMLMHDNSRPFVCTICEKRFTDANNLKVHKYTMHGPGKIKKKKYGANRARRSSLLETAEDISNMTI